MLKWLESRILWGMLLILGGVLFLLQNLGIFAFGDIFWSLLLVVAGVFFLSIFFQHRTNWWSLIPGITLLSIAGMVIVNQIAPNLSAFLGTSIVFGGIALSFLFVYLADRQNWWAIIPMGVLLTLATVSALDQIDGLETGSIFFIGLGTTFALVALLPKEAPTGWAWIPAVILLGIGVIILAAAEAWLNYLWPVALIIAGVVLVFRSLRLRTG